MKKIFLLSVTALFLLVLVTGCTPKASTSINEADKTAVLTTFEGYVIDKHCFDKKPDPALDTKMCLQMKLCEGDGYGIAIKQADSTYKFIKFDAKDHALAKDLIAKTTKKDHISIEVQGTLVGDIINVTSIVEK